MGVRDDLLPLDFADSSTVWDRIKKEKEYEDSPGGRLLTKAAIEVMQQLIPGRTLKRTPGHWHSVPARQRDGRHARRAARQLDQRIVVPGQMWAI